MFFLCKVKKQSHKIPSFWEREILCQTKNVNIFAAVMKKALKYCRILFAAYLALYFVCNAAFIHTHYIDGKSISHAHPVTEKQHTENSAKIVELYNTTAAIVTDVAVIPVCAISFIAKDIPLLHQTIPSEQSDSSHLRAPPVFVA